jgi:site-specific DNA-adenine methylase
MVSKVTVAAVWFEFTCNSAIKGNCCNNVMKDVTGRQRVMEAVRTSEALVNFYQIIRCNVSEHSHYLSLVWFCISFKSSLIF